MKRVVITGMGVISPVGKNAEEVWNAISNGVCGLSTLSGLEEDNLPVTVAGQIKDFDATQHGLTKSDVRHYDRFSQLAVAAALQAMQDSGLVSGENIAPERLGVYMGSGIGGMSTFIQQTANYLQHGQKGVSPLFIPMLIANMGGSNTAIKLNAQGPNLSAITACATGTNTIGEAFFAIQSGRADAIVAGGADATINALGISGFVNCRALSLESDPLKACLPFDSKRRGFVMSEGAAILILEELEHAQKRGANIIAEVCGYGHTCDAYHYTSPRPDGTVTARCINQALEQAGYRAGEEALYINAHGTGTAMNDAAETKAIKIALGEEDARRASISSTKSMTGHLLGAAGAIELLISAMALKHDLVPPTIGLTDPDPACDLNYTPLHAQPRKLDIAISNSLGFGGHNATVALRKFEQC